MTLALFQPAPAAVSIAAMAEPVPAEDYPFYDLAVADKFLTSYTQLVVIERMTETHLHPEEPQLPTIAWFAERACFDGRLPQDLLRDFVTKNQRASRLDRRFGFGVRYRFVSGEGGGDAETSVPAIPAAWFVQQEGGAPDIIDRLAFSRVGLNLRADQALLYVANPRPDGTGAGFLLWFVRQQKVWSLHDTEVLWVSRPDQASSGRR
ncbi:MAG: hypothetical protein ABS70_03270 [Nitrospira sp. SCN 59-13]|nr:MAG: hypothetical protein ABS70_03270 [Nitrospira sp. SCN 59-13]